MSDRRPLELECQLRLMEHMEYHAPSSKPFELWIDGFWAGVRAERGPRPLAELEAAIEMRRAVRARVEGECHANEQAARTATVAPARRKSDAAAAELTAYLAAAHGPKRDRDGA